MKYFLLIVIVFLHSIAFSGGYWETYYPKEIRKVEIKFTLYLMEPQIYKEAREMYWGIDSESIRAFAVHYNNGTSAVFMKLESISELSKTTNTILKGCSDDVKEIVKYRIFDNRIGQFYFTDLYVDLCWFGHEVGHVADRALILQERTGIFNLP